MRSQQPITPVDVLKFSQPTAGYLCPLAANIYGVEFQKFEIRDYDSGQPVYMSADAPEETSALTPQAFEDRVRSIKYTFPAGFLDYRTIRTMLEFKVGEQPLNSFRMIELHYFKNKLIRTYDFTFGFCIPNSVNTWEAIYDVPEYSEDQKAEYVRSPFAHKSDSFYFVDDELIMHNKAEYQYVDLT